MRCLSVITALIVSVIGACAQLASFKPTAMHRLDVPNNGERQFADIEIVLSKGLEGVKVVKNNDGRQSDTKQNSDTVVYAKALSVAQHKAKTITITHPDFVSCVIEFDNIGLIDPLVAGDTYRIDVEVPSLEYVNANKAFSGLEFAEARRLFALYLEDEDAEYAASARSRLEQMDQLQSLADFVRKNRDASDITTRRKEYVAAKDLYKKSGSWEAYRIYTGLEKELLPNKSRDEETGVSRLKLDSVWHDPMKDISAMSEKRLPLVNGENYYAQLMVEVGLDDLTFDGIEQFLPAEKRKGIYYLYVPQGQAQADTFFVRHPDFEPLPIALKDHGISEIKGGRDYHIRISSPPRTLLEADRAFGGLDFNSAILLYSDVLQNADIYDESTLQSAAESLNNVTSLIDEDYAGTWNRIRTELNRIGSASRELLAAKTDTLIRIAQTLEGKGVPGMAYNVKRYADRKDEYLHSVYLDMSVKEMNANRQVIISNGREKPLEAKSLWLEYRIPDRENVYRQHVYSSSTGDYNTYLPKEVSEWLTANPGKEIVVTPQRKIEKDGVVSYRAYKMRSGNRDKLYLSLKPGHRSITADIYIQEK